jgi:HD-like signal output (HDOD) protein
MRDELISLIETKGDLPPIPEVLINLENRVNDPDCDILEISAIIETEPVLSGRLIQLSNSVLFGGGRETSVDVEDSVMRLGIKMVLDLAYTVSLPGIFKKPKGFNQFDFWTHSLVLLISRGRWHIS